MLKRLKSLSEIKKELRFYLDNKQVYDVILFGSYVKGKENPSDIDVAIISMGELKEVEGYHISFLEPLDFFKNIPSLANTLFREGYSLKFDKNFSENYGFQNKCMFVYWLSDLTASNKVTAVNFLRGINGKKGMVEEQGGEWIANQVFLSSVNKDYLFEQFFLNHKIKFKKSYILIH